MVGHWFRTAEAPGQFGLGREISCGHTDGLLGGAGPGSGCRLDYLQSGGWQGESFFELPDSSCGFQELGIQMRLIEDHYRIERE
ncbi:hypothetical protein AWC16_10820 [Mycolicibacter longobardus]|uniref:Uncharacterized protein n=1 Tax=Mycolicibacter longobardus TaxID=1108812 RepID=A0A1X1YKL6_9MYCO|nr:hypothetical protein AWC16_10820 [Mycolicibacter longobardus]